MKYFIFPNAPPECAGWDACFFEIFFTETIA